MAKEFQARPSELYGIHDDYDAFCFDRAVYTFGTYVESEVEKAGEQGKTKDQRKKNAEAKLKALLSGKKEKQYADPAAMFG